MSDRKDHIKNLKLLMDFLQNNNVFALTKEMTDSLRFAIQSLEVDETHQLEYEGMTERGCDRNICIRNEYNNVSCDECEVKHSATFDDFSNYECVKGIRNDYVPTPNVCDDAVSRNAVIETLLCNWKIKFINAADVMRESICGIMILPSVTPKDTISRQKILSYIEFIESHGMGKNKSFDFFKKFVANLPSVELTPWISVKDRLPDEDGVYLVSYDNGDILTSWFDLKNTQFNFFHESVLAWMPLPQPYEVKKQERNTDDSRG